MSASTKQRFSIALSPLRVLLPALAAAVFFGLDIAGLPLGRLDSANWLWAALGSLIVFVWFVYKRLLTFPARLLIAYSPEHPMWWPQQGWYRIKVENQSSWTQAPNVRARVETIVPNPLPFNALPSDLGVKDGDSHDVNPGAYILFDVVQQVPDEERTWRIFLVGSMGQEFSLDPDEIYEMSIRVTAANAEPRDQVFILKHPQGGPAQFSPKKEAHG